MPPTSVAARSLEIRRQGRFREKEGGGDSPRPAQGGEGAPPKEGNLHVAALCPAFLRRSCVGPPP
eukprot:6712978-Pyramimonas_sp.AAC.1